MASVIISDVANGFGPPGISSAHTYFDMNTPWVHGYLPEIDNKHNIGSQTKICMYFGKPCFQMLKDIGKQRLWTLKTVINVRSLILTGA